MLEAIRISVYGRVQGVGFRPFIYQLAEQFHINGTVQNNMDGVHIVAEGESTSLNKMVEAIKTTPPRLARIDHLKIENVQVNGFVEFKIISSDREGKSSLVIPVDASVCEDCLEELRNPNDFRYQYPFINCTQCGPRYTIISELPYDRPYTSMKEFQLCDYCKEEYENPFNRRHHAQPIACPTCGPTVTLLNKDGEELATHSKAINMAQLLLKAGEIIAIKGLGGYHLACDSTNEKAIITLRERKKRLNRPLAIMVPTLEAAKEWGVISEIEEKVLKSAAAPIVILKQKENTNFPLQALAPNLKSIGVMLAYTPLHYLLFENSNLHSLVMTSANSSGLPILYKEDQLSTIKDIADYVLTNNREILHPLDDSVVRVVEQKLYYIRRSRGYVPDPIITTQKVHNIVALGSLQKNTFAIGRENQIFVGPHIGDMEHVEVTDFSKNELKHLLRWLEVEPKKIAIDKHPHFKLWEIAKAAQLIPVQHHHAHHVSCMEDNQLIEPVFGIILDGTGFGEDGHIWGFEILFGDAKKYQRLAHLKYTPLPGGDYAIKEPWRNAVGMLISYLGEEGKNLAKRLFFGKENEIDILNNMMNKKVNSPLAGSCGRLFDAVSAILGICDKATYEGEPAIRLSELMPLNIEYRGIEINTYPYQISENSHKELEIDFSMMLRTIVQEHLAKRSLIEIVEAFHQTVVMAIVNAMEVLSGQNPLLNKQVVLSGGSFQNPYLLIQIRKELTNRGFQVFTHNTIPSNDGGIALGQLIIAANR